MTAEKLKLNDGNSNLKVYFFTVQRGKTVVEVYEDVKAVMAYDDKTALELVRKDYPGGLLISVRKRAELPVSVLVERLDMPTVAPKEAPAPPPPPPAPAPPTSYEFLCRVLYVADNFVVDEKDKADLISIIKRTPSYAKGKEEGRTYSA